MTKKEFINKAKELHDDNYDYRCISDYTNLENSNNVPIICEKHGLFYQSVYDHLNGRGCFQCFNEKQKNDR